MNKEEARQKRELDKARQAGTLPPEKDAHGNLINPHNPEFISKRPWYLGGDDNNSTTTSGSVVATPSALGHQTLQNAPTVLDMAQADALYIRGKKKTASKKFKKGSCKNCGATSHKTQECVERPRKVGAWKNSKNICPDDVIQDVRSGAFGKLAFDAKRDAWLGYDPSTHTKSTSERYHKLEEARKNKQQEPPVSNSDSDSSSTDEDDEFLDKEGKMHSERVARQGGVGGAELKTTVRNLRIREDTAKYLRNLNPNSAFYDPKSRSMRDNPNPEIPNEESLYAGDNFARCSGKDVAELASTEAFAWEEGNSKTSMGVHAQATPSIAHVMRVKAEKQKLQEKLEAQNALRAKYGTQDEFYVEDKSMLYQNDSYMTYDSRTGRRVVKNDTGGIVVRSKYVEDEYEINHTSVWGSWFDLGNSNKWGYECCHSVTRQSYCTGEAGKKSTANIEETFTETRKMLPTDGDTKRPVTSASYFGEAEEKQQLDSKKLKKALKRERQSSSSSVNVGATTAEELEAYRIKKSRFNDPMKDHL